jgi:hypothetical protein
MTRNLLIPSLLLLATVATTTRADAAPVWIDGTPVVQNGACVGGSGPAIQSWVGYHTDTAQPLKTGDVEYVHAVAKNVGCVGDANNFEFFLPVGASLAIDGAHPVSCYRENGSGGSQPVNCLQSPFLGPNNGFMFLSGLQTVAQGWFLEVQIPIVYNHELTAAGGVTHSMGALTQSSFGNMLPVRAITVAYQAQIKSLSTLAVAGTSATVGLNLFSFFEGGSIVIDFGTTMAFGQSTPAASVPTSSFNFPNVQTNLMGLTPSTTYFWRARFITTSHGTFTSATGSFTTAAAPPVVLTVTTTGRGLGKVTSNPAGLDCGAYSSNACSLTVPQGTLVSLYANPSMAMYTFVGWSGACSGTGACTVPMNAAASVTATFERFDGTPVPLPDPRPRTRL